MAFAISNLRERPDLFDTVAHRVWDFSWQAEGVPLAQIADGLRAIVAADSFPFAMVAHDGSTYLGSALGIVSDLDERPQLTPWVAAVWVESLHRGGHIGRALVTAVRQELHAQGHARIYLCARAERHAFYVRQGFSPIEYSVGPKALTVFAMSQDATASISAR